MRGMTSRLWVEAGAECGSSARSLSSSAVVETARHRSRRLLRQLDDFLRVRRGGYVHELEQRVAKRCWVVAGRRRTQHFGGVSGATELSSMHYFYRWCGWG